MGPPGELPLTIYPVRGLSHVISGYGPRGEGKMHWGVDIAPMPAPGNGRDLLAMVDGEVTFGEDPKGGHVAIVHSALDGAAIYYAHLQDFVGGPRSVQAGDVIGHVGQSGNAASTTPHVHIELWPSGHYEPDPPDPTPLLSTAKKVP